MCSDDDDDGAGETAKAEKVLKIVKGRLTARGADTSRGRFTRWKWQTKAKNASWWTTTTNHTSTTLELAFFCLSSHIWRKRTTKNVYWRFLEGAQADPSSNMAFTSRFKPTRFTAANANATNSEASFQIPSSALANWGAQDYLLADVDDDDLDFLKAGDFTLSTPTPASRRASLASARGRKEEEERKTDEGRVEEEEAEVEATPVARRVSRVSVGLGASTASGNRTTAASTSANAMTNTHSEPSPEPEPEVLPLPSHRQPEPQNKIESQPEHGLRDFANPSHKSPSSTPTPRLDNPLPIDPHSAAHTSSTSVSPHSISDDHRSPRPRPTPAVATLINNGNTRARCFRNASAISEENNARFSDSILTHAPAPSISLQEDVAPPASPPLKSSPSPKEEKPRAVETEISLKFSRRGRRTTISSSAVPCECSDACGSADAGPNTRLHLANSATEAAANVVVRTAAAVEEPSSTLRAESAPCASDISRSPTESIIDLLPAVAFSPRSGDYASVEHTSSPACAGAVASASVPIVGDSLPGEEVNDEGQEDQQGVTSIVKSISHSPGSGPVTKRKREEDEGGQINHEVDKGALPRTSVTGPQRGSVAAQVKSKSNSNLHQNSKSKPISTQNRKTSAQQQRRVQSTSQLARLHKKHGLGEREDEVKASTLPDVKKKGREGECITLCAPCQASCPACRQGETQSGLAEPSRSLSRQGIGCATCR